VLHEPGAFELIVPKGDYYLFAFRDANRNLKPEAGEPAGQYLSPTSITASGDGVISDLDFVLSNSGATPLGIAVGAGISGLHSSPGGLNNQPLQKACRGTMHHAPTAPTFKIIY
jgi:hypothetical protein